VNGDLRDAGIAGAGGRVDRLAEGDLPAKGIAESGSSAVYIAWLVRGAAVPAALRRIEQLQCRGGAVDCRRADLIGMGECRVSPRLREGRNPMPY
jgi:hypothetical protein